MVEQGNNELAKVCQNQLLSLVKQNKTKLTITKGNLMKRETVALWQEHCGILNLNPPSLTFHAVAQTFGTGCQCQELILKDVVVNVNLSGGSFKDKWKGFLLLHSGLRWLLLKGFISTATGLSSKGQEATFVTSNRPRSPGKKILEEMCVGIELFKASMCARKSKKPSLRHILRKGLRRLYTSISCWPSGSVSRD